LGSVTFVNESVTGWQQALFSSPIAVNANTVYVASYYAPAGGYAVDSSFFTAAIDNAPLQALATATSPNGLFNYSATATSFPNQSGSGSNYWVDVVFRDSIGTDVTPPVVTARSPAAGATGVVIGTSIVAAFNEPLTAATVSSSTVELRNAANALVPSTVSYNSSTGIITLQPWSNLAPSTSYTVTFRGGSTDPRVKDAAGNAPAANLTW